MIKAIWNKLFKPKKPEYKQIIEFKPVFCDVVHDTYEAAWYILNGARFEKARKFYLTDHRAKHYGYKQQWKMKLSGIPYDAIKKWDNDTALCNPKDLARERMRLKRQIKEYLACHP